MTLAGWLKVRVFWLGFEVVGSTVEDDTHVLDSVGECHLKKYKSNVSQAYKLQSTTLNIT